MTFYDPRDIPGLLVWYSACNQGNYYAADAEMDTLYDLSGNGYHATTGNGTPDKGRYRTTGGMDGGQCIDLGPGTGKFYKVPQAAFLATSGTNGSESMLTTYSYGYTRGPLAAWNGNDQYFKFNDNNLYSDYCSNTRYSNSIQGGKDPTTTWRQYRARSKTNAWDLYVDNVLQMSVGVGHVYNNAPNIGGFGGAGMGLGALTNAGTGSGFKFGGYFLFDHWLTTEEQAFMDQWVDDFPCGGLPCDSLSEPDNLTVTDSTLTSIELSWDPPTIGTADGYEVQIDGGGWTDVGNVFSHDFTGLTPGTFYLLEVRGYNSCRASISASTDTNTETYPFEVRIDGGEPVTVESSLCNVFSGLDPNTEHLLEVRACNIDGCSDWVGITYITCPLPPTNLTIEATLTTIETCWTPGG